LKLWKKILIMMDFGIHLLDDIQIYRTLGYATLRIMAYNAQGCGLLIFAHAKGQKSLKYSLSIMLLLLAIEIKLYTCRGLINS
jgi:hypothetical protein